MSGAYKGKGVRHIIAVLWSHRLARGVLDYAQQQSGPRLEYEVDTDAALEDPDRLVCDGLIVGVSRESTAQGVAALGIPVVNISGSMSPPPFVSVLPDDHAAGHLAAEHLMSRGFRQFAFVGAREAGYSTRRKDGFTRCLLSAGLAQYDMMLSQSRFGRADIVDVLAQWISGLPKPIGMLVDGELITAPVIRTPIREGRAVINGDFTEEEAKRIAAGIVRHGEG